MEWTSYVKYVLDKKISLDDLKIDFAALDSKDFSTPPIIKVSVELLNRFLESGEKHMVMIFPEKMKSSFILAVLKVIYDICESKTELLYNPATFIKGQKLKFQNCVVEFEHIKETNGVTMLWVRDADCSVGVPIELAPFFQLTDTNRRLSKDIKFSRAKKKMKKRREEMSDSDRLTAMLLDYKTHFNNTVIYVTSIGKAKEMVSNVSINGVNVKNLLLIGQSDFEGNIDIINKGQLCGEPSIVLASDLYMVNEAIKKDTDVKLLLIDVSNANLIYSQLDVLDELRKRDFPIIYLTDTVNSFDLDILEQREFHIWRWDEESISKDMYDTSIDLINKKVVNCAEQKIEYIQCDSIEINSVLSILYANKQMIRETTANMITIYDRLFSLAFLCLRNIIELSDVEYTRIQEEISYCKFELQKEKRFISREMHNDFEKVIEYFEIIFNRSFSFPKIAELKERLASEQYKSVCIVVPDRVDKDKHIEFWNAVCAQENIKNSIYIMRQTEYNNSNAITCDVTIVCGWFNSDIMKRIIYSYNTMQYLVLLYDYEQRWKNPHTKAWNQILRKGNKKKLIEKVLPKIHIYVNEFTEETPLLNPTDEIKEIEMVMRDNKYRQYMANEASRSMEETVEAIPINFIGGCFGFYKASHKLTSVTEIVLDQSNDIRMMFPFNLESGDFIVVRESERDIIKDFADIILVNSGKGGLRELAKKWLDSLELGSKFTSFDNIYNKLKEVGCNKNQVTVRQWMRNEDIISPQDKEDLKYIAVATGDRNLLECIDEIYEAGKEVKRAHVQAGRTLSELLKRQIGQKLQEIGTFDPYNIWEPVSLYLDDIGSVKVLKVIDIGSKMLVDTSNINRLIYGQ